MALGNHCEQITKLCLAVCFITLFGNYGFYLRCIHLELLEGDITMFKAWQNRLEGVSGSGTGGR